MVRSIAILCCCAGLQACPGGRAPSLSAAERIAALEAVRDQVDKSAGKDPAAAAQALVAYLRGRPEFKDEGVAPGSVWATLRDGRSLVVDMGAFSPPPAAAPAAPSPPLRGAATMEIPDGKVVLVNTDGFRPSASEIGLLKLDLLAEGYQMIPTTGEYWQLRTDLATGTRDVLHWKTQSNAAKDGKLVLATNTVVGAEDEANPLLNDDFLDDSLSYHLSLVQRPDGSYGTQLRYAIQPNFVRKYMKFPPASLVFIDASRTDDAALQQAFFDAGASVFVGWSDLLSFSSDTSAAVLSFYDGLLGLDPFGVSPPPRMRPFDADSIAAWMAQTGLDKPGGLLDTGARLVVTRHSPDFGLLAPSIVRMNVDEAKRELVLIGLFGTAGDVSVTVGGVQLPVKTRDPTFLVAGPLPPSGPGSAGDVRVIVDQHLSNVVRLTEWHGRVTWDLQAETLRQQVNFDVHMRADVHSFRMTPGATPAPADIIALAAAPDSSANFVFSGTYSAPYGTCTITHEWRDGGFLPFFDGASPLYWGWNGVTSLLRARVDLSVNAQGPAGTDVETVACADGTTSTTTGVAGLQSNPMLLGNPDGLFHVAIAPDFTIQGASFQTTFLFPLVTMQEQATMTVSWADMPASFPPDPDGHR